jgi:hypothetical protein
MADQRPGGGLQSTIVNPVKKAAPGTQQWNFIPDPSTNRSPGFFEGDGFLPQLGNYGMDLFTAGPARRAFSAAQEGGPGGLASAVLSPGNTPLGNALFGSQPDAPAFPGTSGYQTPGVSMPPRPSQSAAPGAAPAPTAGGGGYQAPTGGGYGATGVLSGPGTYEQWYKNHSGQYDQPSELGKYQQGLQGRTGGAGYQPKTQQGAWASTANSLAGTGMGTQTAQHISGGLQSRASQGEQDLGTASGYFKGPNRTAGYAGELGTGMFTKPGQAEGYYDQTKGQITGPNASTQFNQGLQQSGWQNKNTVGDERNYFAPGLREKSNSENLYDSGNQGLNTFYQREGDKQARQLSDRMAAMGVFGSGATARALSEQGADLGASQARDMAGLAAQADQARLARTGAAESFAKSAGGEELARYGLGMSAAGQADENTRGFLELGGNLANNAQKSAMDRATTGANIQNLADRSMFDQGKGLADVGNMEANQYLDRQKSAADIGLRADTEARARANDYFARAGDLDKATLDAEGFNRDTAGGIDKQTLDRLQQGGTAAEKAQNMFETRERYPLQDKMALATQQAGLVQSALGKSADEQRAIADDMINSIVASGAATRAQAEAQVQQMFQTYGIVLQASSSIKGGAKPAAAPAPAPAPVAATPSMFAPATSGIPTRKGAFGTFA